MVTQARSGQRGAAVFIVVMVLTLLTAIGIFAIHSASLVTVASGHVRQGAQTMHFGEYAVRTAIAELGDPTKTSYYVKRAEGSPEQCMVNRRLSAASAAAASCYPLQTPDIARSIQNNYASATVLVPQTADTDGSLGPRFTAAGDPTSALEGVFSVEIHDSYRGQPVAGMKAGDASISSRTVTLTGYAQIRMVGPGGAPFCPAANLAQSASMQAVRAFVTLPAVVQ